MKKFLKSILVVLALVLFVFTVLVPAADAAPFRASVTLTAGSGTYGVTSVYNSASTGVRLSHVIYTCTATATSTASFIVGSITNAIGTKAITATDRLLVATNAPPLLIGDTLRFTSSDTNSHAIYIVGEEF